MSVTMKDVAAYAGISIGTVSNYITGKMPVSPQKQKQIQKAIDELGYQVNVAGRNLRKNRFDTIGILIPDLKNVYLLHIASVMEELLRAQGYGILLSSYHKDSRKERDMFMSMSQRVDAIIYVPMLSSPKWIQTIRKVQKRLPVVIFNEALSEQCCDCVLVDGRQATKETVAALLERGHTEIGIILGPEETYTTKQRFLGYKEALEDRGFTVNSDLVIYGDYSKRVGAELCDQLLQRNPNMSALIVIAYTMTLGAISTLTKYNLRKKIPVIGYDASDLDDVITPQIGYVYQPYHEIAKEVVNLVIKRINGDMDAFPCTVLLQAEIRGLDTCMKK